MLVSWAAARLPPPTAKKSSEESDTAVNAGGDLAVRGGAWPVGVAEDLTLELSHGGIATSGRDRRRWRRDGEELHHLIDPKTGRPAESDLLRVTVVAGSAVEAEVLAKAAFLGADVDVPRVLVTADGRTILAGGLENSNQTEALCRRDVLCTHAAASSVAPIRLVSGLPASLQRTSPSRPVGEASF